MCSYDCSAYPDSINEDNDITGIGVLIGYCATAGIAVFIIVIHYFFSYEPRLDPFQDNQANHANPSLLLRSRSNPIDDIVLRGPREFFHRAFGRIIRRQRFRARLEDSLIKCILSMSDIQIITGISIIISGATQLKCGISTYQWQVLVYLAWFSSLTHLSCLTLLRKYLYQRPAERMWRLICMFILVVLLILAFLPTANYSWQYGFPAINTGRPTPQDYAICYLKPIQRRNAQKDPAAYIVQNDHTFSDHAIIAMSISVILVFVGFVCRVLKLHHNLSVFLAQTIRGRVSYMLRKPLRMIEGWCGTSTYFKRLQRLLLYRPLLAIFLSMRVLLDIWDSLFFEVWWLIISFTWGVERLFSVVQLFPSEENTQWSFGQVMSVALLAIPLVTIFELVYPESENKKKSDDSQERTLPSTNHTEDSFGLRGSSELPAPISRDQARRSFSDHPDYELYYTSGFLTAPSFTLILTIISLSLWCLVRAFMFNGLEDEGFLQISFFPWGVIPLLLGFCIYNSILFSFMITKIGSKGKESHGGNSLLARSLPVLISILLTGTTFVMYAFSVNSNPAGWTSIVVFGIYFLCSLIASTSG